MNKELIVQEALSMMGVPWVHAGRSRTGLDCQGLIVMSYAAVGWQPKNPQVVYDLSYGRRPDVEKMKVVLAREGTLVGIDDMQPADVILFKPFHLAIATSRTGGVQYFLHSNQKVGKVTHTHIDGTWRNRFLGAYRFCGGEV